MKERKHYPWERFQRWLNKQPDNRIAGTCSIVSLHTIGEAPRRRCTDGVIERYLQRRIKNSSDIEVILPVWCRSLYWTIGHIYQGGHTYQFRTVKKAMKIVSRELREQKSC